MNNVESQMISLPLWRRILYPIAIAVLVIADLSNNHKIDRLVKSNLELQKQVATLIAENRRTREHCPPEETQRRSGTLANNSLNRR